MTITVSILIPVGIVLAADSRQMTESPSGQLRLDSDNVEKIIQLGPHLAANVNGQRSFYTSSTESPRVIGEILSHASGKLPKDSTVREAAVYFHRVIATKFKKNLDLTLLKRAAVSFYIAGYNPKSDNGELYRCDVPGNVTLERKTSDAGMVWNGTRDVINRMILGYDPRLLKFLSEGKSNWPRDELENQLRRLQLHINFQTMPMQDAVDLAVLMIRTTVEIQRFADGLVGEPGQLAVCGGMIEIGVITKREGFHWLQHKQLEVKGD